MEALMVEKVRSIEEKLAELHLSLPEVSKQTGNYLLSKQYGNTVYISGVTCKSNGKVQYKGKVGENLSLEDGYEAAKLCALNHLAVIQATFGSLSKVKQVVKLTGYVNCHPDFTDIPKVINGASDLLIELFGDSGKHARCAVGVNSLPGGASVETEIIIELEN
jgi:enamine deaminase RidA (YjgF/YER057c/UK114 family)